MYVLAYVYSVKCTTHSFLTAIRLLMEKGTASQSEQRYVSTQIQAPGRQSVKRTRSTSSLRRIRHFFDDD